MLYTLRFFLFKMQLVP